METNPTDQRNTEIAKWIGITQDPDVDYPECYLFGRTVYTIGEPPDFTESLDAMAEAEKVLVERGLWIKYLSVLNQIVCDDADEPCNQDPETLWCMVHATAQQRAYACLKTLRPKEATP